MVIEFGKVVNFCWGGDGIEVARHELGPLYVKAFMVEVVPDFLTQGVVRAAIHHCKHPLLHFIIPHLHVNKLVVSYDHFNTDRIFPEKPNTPTKVQSFNLDPIIKLEFVTNSIDFEPRNFHFQKTYDDRIMEPGKLLNGTEHLSRDCSTIPNDARHKETTTKGEMHNEQKETENKRKAKHNGKRTRAVNE